MTYKIYTLGCKVNYYESKVVSEILENNGYKESDKADIYIINTCTVTNVADRKSLKLIRRLRRENCDSLIIVMGCMVQNNKNEIDADILIGNKNKTKIIDYINKYKETRIKEIFKINDVPFEDMRLNNFDKTRAYVKIQDGCNNFCSYCIIPYVRGNVRSKQKDIVINEIKSLINNGHKEIVLTGIHTGHYGSEFKDYNFANLLNDILKIKGLERLRISSIEITEITDEVVNIIKNNKVLVDHMHIPLQSGSNKILKLMNRKYDVEYFANKIELLKKIRPNISITTDVIVGFPGETENDYEECVETINKIGFTKIHVFPYSKREGTVAANMENQIDDQTKKRRVKKLLELSKNLEIKYMKEFIGQKVVFIPEIYKDGYLIGHTGNYLLVKSLGKKEELYKEKESCLKKIEYPYITC